MTGRQIGWRIAAIAVMSGMASGAMAQGRPPECQRANSTSVGPDVIVGDLIDVGYYGASGGVHAFAVGTTSCNIGTSNVAWVASNNQHPVIGQNMYRLKDGRFEMIGMSWLKHGFTALTQNLCSTCSGQGGSVLGVGCSDPYTAGLNGGQSGLGPRWQVNPSGGVYVYPFNSPAFSGILPRRLQVLDADINPATNAGALYFMEGQYVTNDDALAGNAANNTSYRRVTFSYPPTANNWAWASQTQCTHPGIRAWVDNDPSVTLVRVDVPNDSLVTRPSPNPPVSCTGVFWAACKVTDNGDGTWHYEYAIQNLTSDRSAGALRFPLPAGCTVQNLGFHDCPYHSGDGLPNGTTARNFDGTDWTTSTTLSSVRWATESYDANPNANALRWGTMYNFRFDTNARPDLGTATIELFKPAATAGDPSEVSITGIPVPTTFVSRNVRVVVDTSILPELVSPTSPTTVTAQILSGDDQLQQGSERVFYRYVPTGGSGPFTELPLSPSGQANTFTANIPGGSCGTFLQFYVQASGTNSGNVTFPVEGALGPIARPVGTITDKYTDGFEAPSGWTGTQPGDTATIGQWTYGAPVGTSYNPGTGLVYVQPNAAHGGTNCWFTGQGQGGLPPNAADVDGGKTTLLSNTYDLQGVLSAKVAYSRWFVSNIPNPGTDVFTVDISNDNGQTWSNLETVPGSAGVPGWVNKVTPVTIPLTRQMKLRFVAQDTGTDDIIEAAIDDLRIIVTSCGNECAADWNHQNGVTVQDLLDFVGAYLAGSGDFNGADGTTVQDLFDYINAFFAGCP